MTSIQMAMTLAAIIALPFVVFVCAKLASYGFYKGRELFLEDQKKKESHERRKAPPQLPPTG